MARQNKPRILCVDDEPSVLSGLRLGLRSQFDVTVEDDPCRAVDILQTAEPFCIVLSDMRMPRMNGAQLLAKAREITPHTVRMLLTGFSELDAAIAAINEGNVFRFLSKPCPPPQLLAACGDALRQYELVTAEKVLLEQTLRGAIGTLSELLGMASPVAFGRAERIKRLAAQVAESLGHPAIWAVEMAATLSHLGYLTLPDELVARVHAGGEVSEEEQALVDALPSTVDRLLSAIPRIDDVRAMIRASGGQARVVEQSASQMLGAKVLDVVDRVDRRLAGGEPPRRVFDSLAHDQDELGRRVVAAVAELVSVRTDVVEVEVIALRPGMVLADDLRSSQGMLLLSRGASLGESLIARLRRFPHGDVAEPVLIERQAGSGSGALADPQNAGKTHVA